MLTDAELQQQLENLSLPFEQWTHRAHIRVAFCYLRQHPFAGALDRVRTAIKAYSAHHNLPEGPTSGYNEHVARAEYSPKSATIPAN
jgi:hypothetical protein